MLVTLAFAVWLSIPAWTHAPNWSNADSLFYQSMSFEVDGLSAQAARARVFRSPLAVPAISAEPAVADVAWQSFESQFSRRRWLLPIATDLIRPIAGQRALPDVAIIGYYVLAVALSLLLLSRFGPVTTVAVATLCLALGPVRGWELRPMTDSWGLALEVLAILLAGKAVTGGRKWIAFWVLTMLALSLTRDLALIPLGGVLCLMLLGGDMGWRRVGARLFVTGTAATIPAYLVFGASARSTLAFQINGYTVPSQGHDTWSYVLSRYPGFAFNNARSDVNYMMSHPVVGLTFVIGLMALIVLSNSRDPWKLLLRGAVLGWVVLLAVDPDYSHFRYELAGLPGVAFGLCLVVERAGPWLASRRAVTRTETPRTSVGLLTGDRKTGAAAQHGSESEL